MCDKKTIPDDLKQVKEALRCEQEMVFQLLPLAYLPIYNLKALNN